MVITNPWELTRPPAPDQGSAANVAGRTQKFLSGLPLLG